MKEIQLAKDRGVALVDDEDFEAALPYTWWRHSRGYAYTQVRTPGKKDTIYLHQLISRRMGVSGAPDHENRNKLDCRRENLRPCTHTQNMANCGVRKHNKLGVKGVRRSGKRYAAQIRNNYKTHHLGTFDTVQEASDVYFEAARSFYGEFASR